MKLFIHAVLLALMVTSLHAQNAEPDWEQKLDAMIEHGMTEQRVLGLAVGIVLDGRLEYARGFGLRKLGQPAMKVTPDTLFHMASVTKPFVATAIMQLVEDGRSTLMRRSQSTCPTSALRTPEIA